MTNIELQSDEISVLKSIFDRNFHQLNSHQFKLLIDIDIPSSFTVRWKNQRIPIRHLPPVSLIIEYHDDYPSGSAPRLCLSCFYLSESDLSKMQFKLENDSFIPGEVCVYQWVELIKSEIGHELLLTHEDDRVNSQIVEELIDYDRERENDEFGCQIQTCSICFDEIQGVSCLRLRLCGHFYCRTCLNNHVEMSLARGLFGERLSCPQTQCQQPLLPNEIKSIIQDERIYERYERLTLQYGLEMMDDILWCPRCQQAVLTGQGEDNLAMCDACQYTFCKKCKELFHSNTMCPKEYAIEQQRLQREKHLARIQKNIDDAAAARREEQSKEMTRATRKQKPPPKPVYRALILSTDEEERVIEDILTSERIELLNTQKCPKCHVRIEKNGGCSHMHCSRCDHHFTWQSLPARQPVPGQFFITSQSAAPDIGNIKEELEKVALKVPSTEEEENVSNESTETKSQILIDNRSTMGALLVNRTRKCPSRVCNHINVKVSTDNFLHCDKCSRTFCFVCGRQNIGDRHFEKKCPRNTSFE